MLYRFQARRQFTDEEARETEAGLRDARDYFLRMHLGAGGCLTLAALLPTAAIIYWLPMRDPAGPLDILLVAALWLAFVVSVRRRLLALLPFGRRYRRSAALVDPRPPVLYLRSFTQEEKINATLTRSYESTFEERLVRALEGLGPVVSVGHASEIPPPAGAARLYLDEKNWQGEVRQLMSVARLVVVNPGTTEGVLWEVDYALRHVEPERLLISLSLSTDDRLNEYEKLRTAINRRIPNRLTSPLPRVVPTETLFIYFEPDWTPRPLQSWEILLGSGDPGPFSYAFARLPSAAAFTKALEPLYAQLGEESGYRGALAARGLRVLAFVLYLYLFYAAFVYARPGGARLGAFPWFTVGWIAGLLLAVYAVTFLFAKATARSTQREMAAMEPKIEGLDILSQFSPVLLRWKVAVGGFEEEQRAGRVHKDPPGDFTRASLPPARAAAAQRWSDDRKVAEALAELDRFASDFTEGRADSRLGFESVGEFFCKIVEDSYDLISVGRADSSSASFANIVELYRAWAGGARQLPEVVKQPPPPG
jgi:hypothetical protein